MSLYGWRNLKARAKGLLIHTKLKLTTQLRASFVYEICCGMFVSKHKIRHSLNDSSVEQLFAGTKQEKAFTNLRNIFARFGGKESI